MEINIKNTGISNAEKIRTDRFNFEYLRDDLESLEIKTEILNDRWHVSYHIKSRAEKYLSFI